MDNLIDKCLEALDLDAGEVVKPKRGKCREITAKDLIQGILETSSGPECAKYLGVGSRTFDRVVRKTFPEVKLSGGTTWKYWVLLKTGLKECKSCSNIKFLGEFYTDNGNPVGRCKSCDSIKSKKYYRKNKEHYKEYREENVKWYSAYRAKRKAMLLGALPAWADLARIKEFYEDRPEGHHVDHIIPLQGEKVCGLHVLENLQYLTAEENLAKGNRFQV